MNYLFTMEDQYTNRRAHAAALWWIYRPEKKRKKREATAIKDRSKKSPKEQQFFELVDKVNNLYDRKRKRLEKKYGGPPFPEITQLIESIQARQGRSNDIGTFVPGLYDLKEEETRYLICAEMEKIILGQKLAETALALEDIKRRISEAIQMSSQRK